MIENTNTLKNRSRRVEYFDSLRITATFFVVMIHTVYLYFNKVDVRSSDWAVFEIYDSLSRWAVPVFVMISGALFLEREKSAKEIYRKNLVRIIIAYIAWSFIYAAIFFVRSQNLKASLNCFIKGRYHMWFLVMLGGLYLATPILRKIAEDKKLVRLFLALGLVFAGIIPELTSVLHMIDTSVTQRLADYLKYYTNNAFIFLPMGFSCYYMLGYALNRYGISKKLEYQSKLTTGSARSDRNRHSPSSMIISAEMMRPSRKKSPFCVVPVAIAEHLTEAASCLSSLNSTSISARLTDSEVSSGRSMKYEETTCARVAAESV